MRCPTLSELPSPPAGMAGWPWTEESPPSERNQVLPLRLQKNLVSENPWPRVSIVTPSYNQAEFLEETIRSVLLQGYPNLEYIVIDGGSTDGSLEIIRKYEPWLAYWESEPDRGQSHALNKGFSQAQGEILAWINSDDMYLHRAIGTAVQYLANHPAVEVVYGNARVIDQAGETIRSWQPPDFDFRRFFFKGYIPQAATLFRRTALEAVGSVDESLHYTMDYDLWMRMAVRGLRLTHLPRALACHRISPWNKGSSAPEGFWRDRLAVLEKVFRDPVTPPSVQAMRTEVLSWNYLRAGLKNLALGHQTQGQACIDKAFLVEPQLARNTEEVFDAVLYYAAELPRSASEDFVQEALQRLPELDGKQHLPQLRRRARILSGGNHPGEIPRWVALQTAIATLRSDRRWLAERGVLRALLVSLMGEVAVRNLACLDRRLGRRPTSRLQSLLSLAAAMDRR